VVAKAVVAAKVEEKVVVVILIGQVGLAAHQGAIEETIHLRRNKIIDIPY